MPEEPNDRPAGHPTRRTLLQRGAAALAAPATLRALPAAAQADVVKIGLVSPRSGPIATFAEADDFILRQVAGVLGAGLRSAGRTVPVQVITRDSQSSPTRAAEVASDLILGAKVDLLLAASTPDTVNPVADQAEANEVPCITTDCPWQPYFFGRRGDPKTGFEFTYHFFWGLEDVVAAFTGLWSSVATNKVVGGLFPNDADGNAWGDAARGFPPALAAQGFRLVDPGRYQPMSNDFTAQISAFKAAGAQIVTGNMIPPDFATFWAQAAQQDFRPKVVTVGKALLFPSVVAGLGERADGLTTEIWWTPNHPFRSSLTGQSARELTEAYTAATGRPWTQPIGFKHALFEVAIDVLKRAKDVKDPKSILAAITETDLATVVGPVRWGKGPVRNVSKTPLVAGQWVRRGGGFDLVVTTNTTAPQIPAAAAVRPLA